MSIKPILFSTSMVRAILEDRKYMTRRIVKVPADAEFMGFGFCNTNGNEEARFVLPDGSNEYVHPKRETGDILWVRETWQQVYGLDDNDQIIEHTGRYLYAATDDRFDGQWLRDDGSMCDIMPWRPSIFMPREAARIWLEVTEVRCERVQDIAEEDAKAEGFKSEPPYTINAAQWTARDNFHDLWDSLNAKRGYGWDANPWVWVISFKRCEKPEGE